MPKISDSDIAASKTDYEPLRPTSSSGYAVHAQQPFMRYGLIAAVVLVVAVLGFVSGMQYQKGKTPAATAATAAARTGANGFAGGGFGGRGGARSGGFGTVNAISASSISVQDERTGTTKTYGITSSTTITDNGSTVDYTDIKSGDTVIIRTSGTTSTDALSILVNPTMGGFGGGAGQSSTPSSQTDSSGSNTDTGTSTI